MMDISKFRAELTAYLNETGRSQSELSRELEIPQSQISSWINGGGTRIGKNAAKVLRVIEVYRASDESPLPSNVAAAARAFCGSSKERSEILTRTIQALQPLAK